MLRATRALSISPFLVVFTLVVPSGALAQGLSVSPNCGTPFTHFIVGGGGWPYPPGVCPDSCTTGLAVMLDSDLNPFYSAPECMASFVVDLQGFPGLLFNRPNGIHTLRCYYFYECQDGQVINPSLLRSACFELRDAAGDPWDTLQVTPDSAWITVRIKPGGACDIPLCDSLHFIQVIRMRGIDSLGASRDLSWFEQYASDTTFAAIAGSRDSLVTPAGYTVDMTLGRIAPYVTYPQFIGNSGSKLPLIAQEATWSDGPRRSDLSYADDIQTIVLECELNAFCTAGEGQGQWLGQCTWTWSRNRGSATPEGTCIPGSCTRNLPSASFRAALDLYLQKTGRTLPAPLPPSQGAMTCP